MGLRLVNTSSNPLPDPRTLVERLRTWGVNADSDVVLYDDGPGRFCRSRMVVADLAGQA